LKSALADRRLIFSDDASLPEKQASEDYGNPYRVMYRWIVNEIQDLLAWKECYTSIHKIENIVKEER